LQENGGSEGGTRICRPSESYTAPRRDLTLACAACDAGRPPTHRCARVLDHRATCGANSAAGDASARIPPLPASRWRKRRRGQQAAVSNLAGGGRSKFIAAASGGVTILYRRGGYMGLLVSVIIFLESARIQILRNKTARAPAHLAAN
jgi:hypothetical protein